MARSHVIFDGFFFSSRRRHTRSLCDWSSDVCSSDLRRFCSSVPASRIGYAPSDWTPRIREHDAQALAISSVAMQMVRLEPLMPPYSSGTGIPRTPFSAKRSEEHTSELQSHSDLVCRL